MIRNSGVGTFEVERDICSRHGALSEESVLSGVASLRQQGLNEQANRLLIESVVRFPDSESFLAEFCWEAHREAQWQDAGIRWSLYRARFPDLILGYSIGCVALREARQFATADFIAAEGLRRFPNSSEMLGNYGWIAHRSKDWREALQRWSRFREKFPTHSLGYSGAGVVHRELGEFDEADAILSEGLKKCEFDSELLGNFAWVAFERHDWPEALTRWMSYREKFPSDPLGHRQVTLVLGELGRFSEANAIAQNSRSNAADDETAKLMFCFESLGDNCQFGIVQRKFDVESLSLLRFTSTPLEKLIDAFNNDFSGVGEPDQTVIDIVENEYIFRDKKYDFFMHTFLHKDKFLDYSVQSEKILRRTRFLKEKLLQDLTEANKIYVYSCQRSSLDGGPGELLHALSRFGENKLLFVTVDDSEAPSQGILRPSRNLCIARINHLSNIDPDLGRWKDICTDTYHAFLNE